MPVHIVTDSTCDLPAEIINRYGIWVIPLYINVGKQSFLDGIDITRQEYYSRLPQFPTHPTTAVPSPEKFRVVYNTLCDEGATAVLSIHISSALSAVIDVAQLAAKEITTFPVTVFDSRQLSLGTGFLVETAARMAEEGCTIEQIIPVLNAQVKRTHVFAVVDTMEFLKRSGRVNKLVAGVGTILQVKPIMKMYDGVASAERVRTTARAIDRLIQLLSAIGPLERLAVVHSNSSHRVTELCQRAARLHPELLPLIADITPVIGTHTGPGAAGFAVVGGAKE